MVREPLHALLAGVAEIAQGRIRHRVADLQLQIFVHLLRVVADAGFLLVARAAAGIIDTARHPRRAAAREAVDGDDRGAAIERFQRGANPGAAKADDDDVGAVVPVGGGFCQRDRRFNAGMPVGIVGSDVRSSSNGSSEAIEIIGHDHGFAENLGDICSVSAALCLVVAAGNQMGQHDPADAGGLRHLADLPGR